MGASAARTQGGTVSLSNGNLRYTPANNFTGTDTLTVTPAADGTISHTDTTPPPGSRAFYRTVIP